MSFLPREMCWECRRARSACWCALVRPFDSDPAILLVAHPKEARNPVGTARIILRCLGNSRLIVGTGEQLERDPAFRAICLDPTLAPAVLYPGPTSVMLDSDTTGVFPRGRKRLVIVIDGTWATAKNMLRDSELLRGLPRVGFRPQGESEYQIRRQPGSEFLSSLEAVHRVLELAGTPESLGLRPHDNLLEVFRSMVSLQLRHGGPAGSPRFWKRRQPRETEPKLPC